MLTVSEVKSDWIKTSSNDLNTQITGWINSATKRINTICRQPILQQSTDFNFIGNDRQIRLAHVTTLIGTPTLVQFRGDPFSNWQTQTTIDLAPFQIEGVWYFYREGYFGSEHFWKITAPVGWAIGNVPLDIKTVCGEMIYQLFKESPYATDQRLLGVTSLAKVQGGVTSTLTFQDMSPRWEMMLEPYIIRTA